MDKESKNIHQMAKEFSDLAELQAYCNAQALTIINLSQQINQKNEEIEHLKKILADNTPILAEVNGSSGLICLKDLSDEEAIAVNEIRKLKDISLVQQLTYEECKKYDIYTKVLQGLRKKEKDEGNAKNLATEDLLSIVSEYEKPNATN